MKFCKQMLLILCFVASLCAEEEKSSYASYFPAEGPFVKNSLLGLLGNQLHQVATAVSLAIDNQCRYLLPIKARLDYPHIFGRFECTESEYSEHFYYGDSESNNYIPIEYKPNLLLYGYFLSYKYFHHNREALVALFRPTEQVKEYIFSKYGDLLAHPQCVALHIRTYDFDIVWREDPYEFYYGCQLFPPPNLPYVEKALGHFPEGTPILVCSDNIEWSKRFLKGVAGNFHFIEKEKMYIDFYLMSLCKNNIIGNSTFSWWAAYLNENKDKIVIAPNPWVFDPKRKLEDTYPDEWILERRDENWLIPCFDGEEIFR